VCDVGGGVGLEKELGGRGGAKTAFVKGFGVQGDGTKQGDPLK